MPLETPNIKILTDLFLLNIFFKIKKQFGFGSYKYIFELYLSAIYEENSPIFAPKSITVESELK